MMKRISTALVAAFVVVGLSFGATQLRAGDASMNCEGYHGPCTDGDCRALCEALYPDNGGIGLCLPNDCCVCLER